MKLMVENGLEVVAVDSRMCKGVNHKEIYDFPNEKEVPVSIQFFRDGTTNVLCPRISDEFEGRCSVINPLPLSDNLSGKCPYLNK